MMNKTEFIKQWIIDNDLFQIPSRTIAKSIVANNPKMFGEYNDKNIDLARNTIRVLRNSFGSQGEKQHDKLFSEKFHGYIEPDLNEYEPFIIPDSVTRLGILNDIHIPFHDRKNLNAAIDFLKRKEINGILLNGDIIDCYKSSSFLKDPRKRNLTEEFAMLREFIDELNATFNCEIYYKLANHEERIENLVMKQVPELVGFLTFEGCLADGGNFNFDEYKLTIIKNKRIVKFTDNLSIIHGHEYRTGMFNPVGVARWLYTKARENSACGHAHKKDSFAARNIKQEVVETHAIGCLCQMTPEYMPLNDWQAGFAYVRRTEHGYKFSNMLIIDGEVM